VLFDNDYFYLIIPVFFLCSKEQLGQKKEFSQQNNFKKYHASTNKIKLHSHMGFKVEEGSNPKNDLSTSAVLD